MRRPLPAVRPCAAPARRPRTTTRPLLAVRPLAIRLLRRPCHLPAAEIPHGGAKRSAGSGSSGRGASGGSGSSAGGGMSCAPRGLPPRRVGGSRCDRRREELQAAGCRRPRHPVVDEELWS